MRRGGYFALIERVWPVSLLQAPEFHSLTGALSVETVRTEEAALLTVAGLNHFTGLSTPEPP
jgi:hypothetical protein